MQAVRVLRGKEKEQKGTAFRQTPVLTIVTNQQGTVHKVHGSSEQT